MSSAGIYSIGTCLPPDVRRNDWWSPETVARWREKRLARMMDGSRVLRDADTEGVRRVLEAMAEQADDPFLGGKERRAWRDGEGTSVAQIEAVQNALDQAGVLASEVDALIEYSSAPDVFVLANGPAIHRALGFGPRCMTFTVDAACNSFLLQLSVASALISAGVARRAVLVQCNALSLFAPPDEPFSPWFGDGATAVVLGPTQDGFGLLGQSHRTESALHRAIQGGTPGKWHHGERIRLYTDDPAAARVVMTGSADRNREVLEEAMRAASVAPSQISYFGNHPATVWFADVTRAAAGLSHAKTVDTFAWTGNLGAANIPFSLDQGARAGLLGEGDYVAMCGGGAGLTVSAAVMRWGGRA